LAFRKLGTLPIMVDIRHLEASPTPISRLV
jgi:hypothetical protein